MENIVNLKDIEVVFEDGERILKKINLDIKDKEFVTFLGPSGCGKTTTLRIIGGFLEPTSGDVFFEGKRINGLPPYKRNVNTVFQRYALFPHLNVYENIAFGLRVKKLPDKEIVKRVGEMLLDEPLGALDLKLRKEMQTELRKIQQALELTFIYVTHDQEEALTMSDTVVVMNNGNIQQIGSPTDIYNEPVNAFVADFIGESNILNGIMPEDCVAEFSGHRFECVDKGFAKNEKVDVVIRPEDIKIVPPANAKLTGIVESVVFKGVHYEMTVDGMEHKWIIHSTLHEPVGTMIGMDIAPFDIHIMKKSEE